MIIKRIRGFTREVGKSQGFIGLPMRDEIISDSVYGEKTPCMLTAWEPTPAEIEAILAGKPVILRVLGMEHPPVMIYVGDDH